MGTGKKENCDKNAENTHSEVSGKDFIALSSPVSSTRDHENDSFYSRGHTACWYHNDHTQQLSWQYCNNMMALGACVH